MTQHRKKNIDALHLPEGMRYSCVKCGWGCKDFWEIPVEPESVERLGHHDFEPHQQQEKGKPAFVESEFEPGQKALYRVNDRCNFLCEDNTCSLHKALGPKEKPQSCIDFPWRYVETPQGPYIGLSFACTAVLEDHGTSVEEQRADISENYTESVHVQDGTHSVMLTGRISLDFDAYLELEKALDEILLIPNTPLNLRLLAQNELMGTVRKAFEVARLESTLDGTLSDEDKKAAADASDLAIISGLINRFREDKWGRLIARGQARPVSHALNRAFIGLVTTFRQALWRGATRATAMGYILQRYSRSILRIGRVHLQPIEAKFSFSEFKQRIPKLEPDGDNDALLTRYFRHALFRKDMLLADNLTMGHRFLLMNYALVYWYSVAEMVSRDTRDFDVTIAREALRNVEKYYVTHTTFARFLERQPVLGTLIDSVMASPRYAAAMVHSPVKAE